MDFVDVFFRLSGSRSISILVVPPMEGGSIAGNVSSIDVVDLIVTLVRVHICSFISVGTAWLQITTG
jgi:hypothetical protein